MGAYLSAPVTDKERHAGASDFLEYGAPWSSAPIGLQALQIAVLMT